MKERVDSGEAVIRHLGTKEMFANLLTKPLQGGQFVYERKALTEWEWEDKKGCETGANSSQPISEHPTIACDPFLTAMMRVAFLIYINYVRTRGVLDIVERPIISTYDS